MEAVKNLSLIPSESAATQSQLGVYSSFFGPDPMGLLGVVVLTSLGTWGLPQMVHKFYAIKDEKAIKTGTVISTLFAVVVAAGSYFNGAFGRLYVEAPSAVGGFDGIVPAMLSGQLSDILMGIVVVLVLSASMSTLSSLVITSSSTFVLDFVKGRMVKDMSEKRQMLWIRGMCAAFILMSVLLAIWPGTLISTLMSLSWGVLGGAFLAPLLYGLFWKGATMGGLWTAFIVGVGLPVGNAFFAWMSPINAGAVAMVASLIVCPMVSLMTRKPDRALVDNAFAGYDEQVTVQERYVLKPDET